MQIWEWKRWSWSAKARLFPNCARSCFPSVPSLRSSKCFPFRTDLWWEKPNLIGFFFFTLSQRLVVLYSVCVASEDLSVSIAVANADGAAQLVRLCDANIDGTKRNLFVCLCSCLRKTLMCLSLPRKPLQTLRVLHKEWRRCASVLRFLCSSACWCIPTQR